MDLLYLYLWCIINDLDFSNLVIKVQNNTHLGNFHVICQCQSASTIITGGH